MKAVRISAAEIARAKEECAKAGVRLVGFEKHPDGTVRFEIAEFEIANDWRAESELYRSAQ